MSNVINPLPISAEEIKPVNQITVMDIFLKDMKLVYWIPIYGTYLYLQQFRKMRSKLEDEHKRTAIRQSIKWFWVLGLIYLSLAISLVCIPIFHYYVIPTAMRQDKKLAKEKPLT